MRYKRISYNLNVMQQSPGLVINPITVDGFAALFTCTPVGRAPDSMMARPKAIYYNWLGPGSGAQLSIFVSDLQWCSLADQGSPSVMQHIVSVESSSS